MALHLEDGAYAAMAAHAEQGYPNEICGILFGKDGSGGRDVHSVMPIDNAFETGEQYHRFLITPQDMLKAERLARQQGLDVLGVYHSHPDDQARPSEYDREHAAWTAWNYIIISVREGKVADLKAWKLREDRSAFDEEPIQVSSSKFKVQGSK